MSIRAISGGTGVPGRRRMSPEQRERDLLVAAREVLREVGYDPETVSGWAFGCGLERFAMVRYEMNDIREFVENTPAFLEQTA